MALPDYIAGRNDVTVKVKETKAKSGTPFIKDYSLEEIAEMPLPSYYRKKDRILNARKEVYRDKIIIDPAAAWGPANPGKLFVRGIGEEGVVANTGAVIPEKNFWHTNMLSGGEFESDAVVIVHSFEFKLWLCSAMPVAANINQGLLTNTVPAAETAQQWSASLAFHAFISQTQYSFFRSDQQQEKGLLDELTCILGPTASYGGDVNEGFIQNAIPVPNNRLDRVKIFTNGKFSFRLDPAIACSYPSWIVGEMRMRARRIGTLYY